MGNMRFRDHSFNLDLVTALEPLIESKTILASSGDAAAVAVHVVGGVYYVFRDCTVDQWGDAVAEHRAKKKRPPVVTMLFRGHSFNLRLVTTAEICGAGQARRQGRSKPDPPLVPAIGIHVVGGRCFILEDCTLDQWDEAVDQHKQSQNHQETQPHG